jgi:IS1 family transposase/transposase-like protein
MKCQIVSPTITCQNPDCEYYLTSEGSHVIKNGRNKAGHQTFYCKHCKKYFPETKNTPFYRSHLSKEQIMLMFLLFREKISILGITRVLMHHEDTIMSYFKKFAYHAMNINDFFILEIECGEIEMDEIWTYIMKKNKNLESGDDNSWGDFWIFTAVKRDSKLLICFKGGKRDQETCNEFVNELFERLQLPKPDNRIKFFTDGNYNYIDPIAKTYCEPCMEYGQIIKQKENGRIVSIERRSIFNVHDFYNISTSIVEGMNNKLRQKVSRLGRKVSSFSKTTEGMLMSLNIFQFVSNFMDIKNGRTPMMAEGITDRPWTSEMFLNYHHQL